MSNMEQTLSIIKPDAVERNLQDEIKKNFINNGFNIKDQKKIQISKSEAEEFYKVHSSKPFYGELCSYLSSGPIVVMILEKDNAVLENRKLMGATDPSKADEGTLRKSRPHDGARHNSYVFGMLIDEFRKKYPQGIDNHVIDWDIKI